MLTVVVAAVAFVAGLICGLLIGGHNANIAKAAVSIDAAVVADVTKGAKK